MYDIYVELLPPGMYSNNIWIFYQMIDLIFRYELTIKPYFPCGYFYQLTEGEETWFKLS